MGTPLPVVSCRQVCNALGKIGFREIQGRGKGSHVFLHHEDPQTGITVPNEKEVKRGTLRAIVRQAGLTVEQFVALLD